MTVEFVADWISRLYQEGHSIEKAVEELRRNQFPPDLVAAARSEFEQRLNRVRTIERPAKISRRDPREWYAGPKSGDRCWPHLKGLLEAKGWGPPVIDSVDQAHLTDVPRAPRTDSDECRSYSVELHCEISYRLYARFTAGR